MNELLLRFAPEAAADEPARAASSLGARLVGRVARLALAQVEVPAASVEELQALAARARELPGVRDVSLNLIATPAAVACPPRSDLDNVSGTARCALEDTRYFEALSLFELARPALRLSNVKVAVLDTGVAADDLQFARVALSHLDGKALRDTDPAEHGTQVCGVIAADGDGQGVSGIASRFLGTQLELMVGSDLSAASLLALAERAVLRGASIVNLSATFGRPAPESQAIRAAWTDLMTAHPDVLFVQAAPNEAIVLDGVALPNAITVGGTRRCDPGAWAKASATGTLVDLAAPAEGIPVVGLGDGRWRTEGSGNSLAAAQVTSLAAILKAISPAWDGARLKQAIVSGGDRMFAGPPRLVHAASVAQALREQGALGGLLGDGASGTLLDMHRACGGLQYAVAGMGSLDYLGGDARALGSLYDDAFGLGASTKGRAFFNFNCPRCVFGVQRSYPMVANAVATPGRSHATVSMLSGGTVAKGASVAGSLRIESCRVTARDAATGRATTVEIEGSFEGDLAIGRERAALRGWFRSPFLTAAALGLRSPLLDATVEQQCD